MSWSSQPQSPMTTHHHLVHFFRLLVVWQALESFQAKGDTTSGNVAEPPSPASPAIALAADGAAAATSGAASASLMPGAGGAGGGIPGTSSNDAREALRFLFSKDGEFFREFLLDEACTLLC